MNEGIKSIVAAKPGGWQSSGWNVRARMEDGREFWLTAGAPYTQAQAELAALNARRDVGRHGFEAVFGRTA